MRRIIAAVTAAASALTLTGCAGEGAARWLTAISTPGAAGVAASTARTRRKSLTSSGLTPLAAGWKR